METSKHTIDIKDWIPTEHHIGFINPHNGSIVDIQVAHDFIIKDCLFENGLYKGENGNWMFVTSFKYKRIGYPEAKDNINEMLEYISEILEYDNF